jgi:hypothetical protein
VEQRIQIAPPLTIVKTLVPEEQFANMSNHKGASMCSDTSIFVFYNQINNLSKKWNVDPPRMVMANDDQMVSETWLAAYCFDTGTILISERLVFHDLDQVKYTASHEFRHLFTRSFENGDD